MLGFHSTLDKYATVTTAAATVNVATILKCDGQLAREWLNWILKRSHRHAAAISPRQGPFPRSNSGMCGSRLWPRSGQWMPSRL